MDLTYASYLKLKELLELQRPRSSPPEHDEMLFIVVHQVYELWFKQLLHEFEKVKDDFTQNKLYDALHTLKRCRTILKVAVAQLDILETMTPVSFNAFRDRLEQASGFQSMQFREVEFMLGMKRPGILEHYRPGLPGLEAAQRRLRERSLVDHFYDFLEHYGVEIPVALRARDVTLPTEPSEPVQTALLGLMRDRPELAVLFELMLDFDEGQQEWRYRHVKIVERTIGNKGGTGGSLGVAFLKRTLFNPIFPDLWAIRHRL